MPKIGITQEDVIKAAEIIVGEGRLPTATKIRNYLGCGSSTTIHKYLQQWKQQCFQKKRCSPDLERSNNLSVEVNNVKQALTKQTIKNEELAAQLIQAEQNLAQLKEANQTFTREINLLKEQKLQLEGEKEKYKAVFENMVTERDEVLAAVFNQQNQLVDSLRWELKEVNQASIEQIKELGRRGDDALMEEKVKTINLQAEVSQQQQIIEELKVQLLKKQEIVMPLKKKR